MVELTRRGFVVSAVSGAGAAMIGADARAQQHGESPDRLDEIVRILGRTDGGVAIRWTRGVLSGIVGQTTTRLLGVSQQIFSRHRRNEDGSWEACYLELVYFTDLATGAVSETWRNPYTGRDVAVPTQALGPTRFKIAPTLRVINQPYALPGIENTHWFEQTAASGDDVGYDERIESFVPPMTDGGAPMVFHEVFSFQASRADLRDRTRPYVPATVHKVNVISWRNWMDMTGAEGVTMSHGAGRMARRYDDVPADLSEKNRAHFPDVIDNLDDYLAL
ncbi:MAG: DUF1838 family protein [Rhodospirillaceae bacterium]|nr:DUF1838 family protein [Rhodospirillaceae bacterium]